MKIVRHFLPSFPPGVLVSSPRQSQNVVISSYCANPNVLQELDVWQKSSKADHENSVLEETESSSDNNVSNGSRCEARHFWVRSRLKFS